MNERRILEALLGLILIILLVIMTTLLLSPNNQTGSTTTITNSFNTNNYYNTQQKYSPTNYKTKDYDYLDYDYHTYKEKTKGLFGNTVEHYVVYVKNQDYKPGYFRVNYYFTDYYGDTKTETMTYYIKPKESKKFIYTNIYKDKYKFHDWNYKVTSRTLV